MTAVFIVGYLAFSIPALIAGVATTEFGLHSTALVYSASLAALVAVAAGIWLSGSWPAGPGALPARTGGWHTMMALRQPTEVSMTGTGAGSDNSKQAAEIEGLAQLLHETAGHHGAFEAVAPPHDWWDWYAAYMRTRQASGTSDEAVAAAGRYMAEVKHVVVPPA